MKKKITQLRWLATMLMLVAAMVMPSAVWAQESTVTFTAKEGTVGFSNESYDKLIDGKYTSEDGTKWCLSFSSADGAYIIFNASEAIQVTGYSIVTGNDNAQEAGRNPKSWALYGCNDASAGRDSENWVLIDQKNDDTVLQDENYQKYDFTSLSNPPSVRFLYFKMEITAIHSGTVMQMSELILAYSPTCDHQWVKTGDVVAPTCTEGGYDVYKCSLCQLTKNVANDNGALGHDWKSGTVVPPTCTTDGYTPQTCSRCHAEQIINIVNATGHQWGNDDVCDVCQINNTVLNIPQGDGTLANPYKISTVGELFWFAGLVNGDASVCDYNETEKPTGTKQNTAACAVLIADISVNNNLLANLNEDGTVKDGYSVTNWKPIGNYYNRFTGTFDGKGHTFSGLYFNDTNTEYVGLFGFNQGTIKNVGVVDSYFKGNNNVGGVCGFNRGFAYVYEATATITNCYNTSSVSGNEYVGGVCGYNKGVTHGGTAIATTTDCYNTGSVSGNKYIGGVCGYNIAETEYGEASAIISNCHNTGSVSGNEYVGGVCGYNKALKLKQDETATATATITNCYFYSTAYSGDAIGGNSDGTISNVESKTADQFKSGEVAWLLNGKKSEGTVETPLMWYQNLSAKSGDAYPVLTSTGENTVYGGYKHGETTIHYSNTATHAHAYVSSAADEANGNHDKSYQSVFNWVDNDDKTNATVTATFTCAVCGKTVTPDMTAVLDQEHSNATASCTEKAQNTYTTSYAFRGATFTDTYVQVVTPALGHNMNAITFNDDKKIYSNKCQREGCGYIGYYATSDGMVEARYEDGVYKVPIFCLNDGLEYDSKAQYTVDSLEYKRMYYDDKWAAVYVPFAIDCNQLPNFMEMAVINNFHEYEQTDGSYNVVLEVKRKTSGTIPALTPCVIRLKEAPREGFETVTMRFLNAMFSPAADKYIDCSSVTRSYKFSGSLARIEKGILVDGRDFVLNKGKLYKANEQTVLLPQRWYLSAEDRAGSSTSSAAMLRSISINVIGDSDGDVTGIEDIHVVTEKVTSVRDGIFDLQGRRLNSEPTNGIYIKNGVKYVK